ncbi:MAG: hypothetical protein WBZ51_03465 [Xanthobacteraceae bacterium]
MLQRRIHQWSNRPQRVIVRHQALRACVAEQFAGLTIRSAHRSHLCLETAAENQIDTGSGKGFFRSLLNPWVAEIAKFLGGLLQAAQRDLTQLGQPG